MWVYVSLNILFGLFLIAFALLADSQENEKQMQRLVSMALTAAVISFLYAVSLPLSFFAGEKPAKLTSMFVLVFMAAFSRQFMLFCFQFPDLKKSKVVNLFSIGLFIGALYVLFYRFKSVLISYEVGLVIDSPQVGSFNVLWSDLFIYGYLIGQPLLGILNMALRMDAVRSKLARQQIFLIMCSTAAFGVIFKLIHYASVAIPYGRIYNTLLPFAFCVCIVLLYKSVSITVLFDFRTLFVMAVRFFYTYVIQCVAAGLLFACLQPVRAYSILLFYSLFVSGTVLLMLANYYLQKLIRRKRTNSVSYEYAKSLEDDLASINYDDSSEIITERLADIFKQNVDTSFVTVLIESGDRNLKTVYSTDDSQLVVPLDNPMFDIILNADHPVVFRTHIETHHVLAGARAELGKVLDKANADAMIVLREGRHIFGVIFLGAKRLGNVYTDYDLKTFHKLYSYFFVIGYYMKNIANESVVGTVNRELQFSGQIIQSIQNNIDKVDCPYVDIGYKTQSARALGGEFLDFIRIAANKYIFVIGDMSGKGINASMSMVIMKSILRTFLGETTDFKELVQKVNSFIRFNLPKGTFWAGLFGILDFSDNSMYYINCGIPGLFMYNHVYNNVVEIQGAGRVLGFASDVEKLLKVKKVNLAAGDILVACTDGVINSKSLRGEMFGKGRVQTSILENQSYPAERMVQFLFEGLFEFTSKELEDDITVVAIKYLPK